MSDKIEKTSAITRLITAVVSVLPKTDDIRVNNFKTSGGARMTFTRRVITYKGVPDYPAFELGQLAENGNGISTSQWWTAAELRELAEECEAMAEYLDTVAAKRGLK